MRIITASIPASVTVNVEVEDSATDAEVAAALVDAVPKYPEIKAGQDFDPEDFTILSDEPQVAD